MTTQRVTPKGRWTGFQGANGDDAAAHTATTDLINILDSVEVPIVRRDFVTACFNKAAADVLGLSPSDIGRASRYISVLLQILLALHTVMGAVWKFSNSEQTVPSLKAIPHGVWLAGDEQL